MAWEIRRGLDGMRKVVRENRIQGVHGVLIDLMDVMTSLHCAVEVACPAVLVSGQGCEPANVMQKLCMNAKPLPDHNPCRLRMGLPAALGILLGWMLPRVPVSGCCCLPLLQLRALWKPGQT